MGLSVDTSRTFEFVFVDSKALPAEQQRAVVCRYVSARRHGQMERLFEETRAAASIDDAKAKIVEGLQLAAVGCRNLVDDDGQPVTEVAQLDAALTLADLFELRDSLPMAMTVSSFEKKRLASRAPSTTASSADGPAAAA